MDFLRSHSHSSSSYLFALTESFIQSDSWVVESVAMTNRLQTVLYAIEAMSVGMLCSFEFRHPLLYWLFATCVEAVSVGAQPHFL